MTTRATVTAATFWQHADCVEDGCWLWHDRARSDYGSVKFDGIVQRAHRVAFMLNGGLILPNQEMHHWCEIPACIRPSHLVALTQSEHRNLHNRTFWRIMLRRPASRKHTASHFGQIGFNNRLDAEGLARRWTAIYPDFTEVVLERYEAGPVPIIVRPELRRGPSVFPLPLAA